MKILLLTSVYKDMSLFDIDLSTNIVNSFSYSWIEQGHDVLVIHNSHLYPKIVHKIPKCIRKKLSSFFHFQIADYITVRKKKYYDSNVLVYRLPIKKYIPHQSPSKRKIILQVKKIVNILEENSFIPDVIVGHWASPQMEIIYYLKEIYNCNTAVVLHGLDYINSNKFDVNKYLKHIDKLGCRSLSQAVEVKKMLNLSYDPFVCYSGIPDEYIKNYKLNLKKFDNIKKWKISFVGRLIGYKNIDVILKSLAMFKNFVWELNIVGDGAEKENLLKLSVELGIESRVKFLGKVSRNEVMNILKESNLFVMVSSNEVFGLVYLEAMAASCLTIASKNGGVDGIIKDGINGFLCEQENVVSLKEKLEFIFHMDSRNLKELVKCGYNTVCQYTDSNAAKEYLQNVISK